MTRLGKIPWQARFEPGSSALREDALTTRPKRLQTTEDSISFRFSSLGRHTLLASISQGQLTQDSECMMTFTMTVR